MKRRKWLLLAVTSVVMSLMFGLTAFAAVRRTGAAPSVQDIRERCPDSNVTDGRRVNDISSIEGWLFGLEL